MKLYIAIGVVLLFLLMSFASFAQKQISTQAFPSGIADRLNNADFMEQGDMKIYKDKYLDAISLPIGGIGSGCIQINGKAERSVWQIFNNYCEAFIPDSFFAIRSQVKNKAAVVKALQTSQVGPFEKMDSLTFRGEYPFGWYDFIDKDLPVKVSLETFNPLIPLNSKDSSIPCAIFNFTVSNPNDTAGKCEFIGFSEKCCRVYGFGKTEMAGPGWRNRL